MNEYSTNLSECQLALTEASTNTESSDCSDVEQQANQLQITISIYEQQNEALNVQLQDCQSSLTSTTTTEIPTTNDVSIEEVRECLDVT